MPAYPGIDGEGGTPEVSRELIREATRAGWLQRLKKAGLPVREGHDLAGASEVHSVEPTTGDPQLLSLLPDGESEPWWMDRRTLRPSRIPQGSTTDVSLVETAADLADRAQLELGRPVSLKCVNDGDRVFVVDVSPLRPRVAFTNASYRRIAPLIADPGTLCPLAVDILDQALRRSSQGGSEHEALVRRLFGQAYRRLDDDASRRRPGGLRGRLLRAGKALRGLLVPTAEAARFRHDLAHEVVRFDAEQLDQLDTEDLLETLNARIELVAQALSVLEHSRLSTLALLPVLTRLSGPISPEQLAALAEPIPTPERRAINDRLIALGHALTRARNDLSAPEPGDPAELRRAFARAQRTLARVRVLGMDVRPGPLGESNAELIAAVREARSSLEIAPDQRRREAERELLEATAAPLSHAGAPFAHAAFSLLRRVARTKGEVADGLSLALLHVRAAVLEAGQRLSQEGILDEPEDVFYLEVDELLQALRGELGAYAARSRFRREDDLRWRNFKAPQRIGGRRAG